MKFYFSLLLLFWLQHDKASDATTGGAKPNILMFVIDDLGWNDTSYQGSEIPTPNIDKFAKEGIRLQQYYVQRACSPTRAAILAGRYPYHMGLARAVISNGHPLALPLNQTTIADELKKGGYATYYVGKWGVGMHKWEYTPTYRGFDNFFGFYNGAEDYYMHTVGALPTYKVADDDVDDYDESLIFYGLDFRNGTKPVRNERGMYSTHLFTKAIEEAIYQHDVNKVPFFIYGAYQSVRAPLQAPEKYLDQCQFIPFEKRQKFCGLLRATDEGIGNITSLLQEKNLLDNTIIIFTTDNGGQAMKGSSNWPLRGNKNTVFEGGVHGAAYVWGANLPKLNYDNHQLIHVTDWLPTIVEGIAGLELDKDKWALDGYNVWPTITTNSLTPRKEILINLDPVRPGFVGQAAIRSGEWKLITGIPNCTFTKSLQSILFPCPDGWIHKNGIIEPPPYTPNLKWLFNIKDDPNERNNVADLYPQKVQELEARIEHYNSTHIPQHDPPIDPKSNPILHAGVWTPWMN